MMTFGSTRGRKRSERAATRNTEHKRGMGPKQKELEIQQVITARINRQAKDHFPPPRVTNTHRATTHAEEWHKKQQDKTESSTKNTDFHEVSTTWPLETWTVATKSTFKKERAFNASINSRPCWSVSCSFTFPRPSCTDISGFSNRSSQGSVFLFLVTFCFSSSYIFAFRFFPAVRGICILLFLSWQWKKLIQILLQVVLSGWLHCKEHLGLLVEA